MLVIITNNKMNCDNCNCANVNCVKCDCGDVCPKCLDNVLDNIHLAMLNGTAGTDAVDAEIKMNMGLLQMLGANNSSVIQTIEHKVAWLHNIRNIQTTN